MRVSVVAPTPQRQEVVEIDVPEGGTVDDALHAVRGDPRFAGVDWAHVRVGIWSRECAAGTRLSEGDRIEIYRPLAVDPKTQRRSRARLKPSTRSRNAP